MGGREFLLTYRVLGPMNPAQLQALRDGVAASVDPSPLSNDGQPAAAVGEAALQTQLVARGDRDGEWIVQVFCPDERTYQCHDGQRSHAVEGLRRRIEPLLDELTERWQRLEPPRLVV